MRKLSSLFVLFTLVACSHATAPKLVREPEIAAGHYSEAWKAPAITYVVRCVPGSTTGCDNGKPWEETRHNLVLTPGKTDITDKYLKGSAYTAAWYMLLKGTGTISAADTLASHAGWTEQTPYAGNRPAITWGTTTSGSNTATQVSISITGTATVRGACIASVNTGTSGILYSCTDFAADRNVANSDTLQITPTITISQWLRLFAPIYALN